MCRTMLACRCLFDSPDVLVVDAFNRKLHLVLLDGGKVPEEVIDGVAVA